jgi:hypothetical protein
MYFMVCSLLVVGTDTQQTHATGQIDSSAKKNYAEDLRRQSASSIGFVNRRRRWALSATGVGAGGRRRPWSGIATNEAHDCWPPARLTRLLPVR